MNNITRTRWVVYLDLEEGYIYCERGGWISINIIAKSEDRIKSFASKDIAESFFPNHCPNIQFIEVEEHICPINH